MSTRKNLIVEAPVFGNDQYDDILDEIDDWFEPIQKEVEEFEIEAWQKKSAKGKEPAPTPQPDFYALDLPKKVEPSLPTVDTGSNPWVGLTRPVPNVAPVIMEALNKPTAQNTLQESSDSASESDSESDEQDIPPGHVIIMKPEDIFQKITIDGKKDRMEQATQLLERRIQEIQAMKAVPASDLEKHMVKPTPEPIPTIEEWTTREKLATMQIKDCTNALDLQHVRPKYESTALRQLREKMEEAERRKREEEERLLALAREYEELRLQEEARQAEVNRRWLEQAKKAKETEVLGEITKMLQTPEARLGMAVVYLLGRNSYADLEEMVRNNIRAMNDVYVTTAVQNRLVQLAEEKKYDELIGTVSEDVMRGNKLVPKNSNNCPKLYDMSILDSYDLVPDN
jgi:hypothetical protein